ncbi:hypothetical protein PHYSODRAFT_339079 [Phytophthora sojae]|uniref:Uncharacterized protein n=1 Tax=Phytophthora sojae (strain P6497) TaxID=1094619 RepID=G5A5N1_PHYSP|nr:hypothetical protein PHYSODRAFT_339079 [Phytophthora sojae]EGZ08636.1 hypothetical protein PHYSODRAFT_339079 [Phytophthora sojae]|eukprot:XP_009535269.1 hypothetical protein PHYSODRAFT_339079 [Phytophthora sojae]
MATVLGPAAINETKFTMWSEQGRALGLEWDMRRGTITIPSEKITKAQRCIADMVEAGTTTKTSAISLLGCLRHISTCCPPARAFYQRLQGVAVVLGRTGRRKLPAQAVEDLKWFRLILHHSSRFNRVHVEQFARLDEPTVHVFMDASNQGLCVLEPALKQFIRVQFAPADQELFLADQSANSINVCEFRSATLAALLWGPTWALSRGLNAEQADNPSRSCTIDFCPNYSLVCTAAHIPGADNIMADAGSRAWSRADQHFDTWTNLSSGWTQVPVVAPYDDLSPDAYFLDRDGRPVSCGAANSVTIGLAGSKNDQYGRGAWRTMHATGNPMLCLTTALRLILRARRDLQLQDSAHLCVDLSVDEVNQALKVAAASIGVPAANYSTHSIRSGGAAALLNG